MAFLERPHSNLTILTPIVLEVDEEPCHLWTARLFGLQWATSSLEKRVVRLSLEASITSNWRIFKIPLLY